MRAVDYVTNGFGGPMGDLARLAQTPEFQAAAAAANRQSASLPVPQLSIPPDVMIRNVLRDEPESVVNAAIQTYRRFGASGFVRTANFVNALQRTDDAFLSIFPGALSGQVSGARFKQIFNGLLNTAASRTGLTPFSSLIIQGYREVLAEIPDNYPNALGWWQTRIKNTLPQFMANTYILNHLSKILP